MKLEIASITSVEWLSIQLNKLNALSGAVSKDC